jgi:hypothetical protein
MRFGAMIFKLYQKNNVMPESELDEIEKEYKKWLDGAAKDNKMTAKVVEWQELWWVRMIVAGVYMWLQKKVYDWMHPEFDGDDDDEDDDERD